MKTTAQAISISDELVDAVEQEVGMGVGAWDMVDPKEIIAACIKCAPNHTAAANSSKQEQPMIATAEETTTISTSDQLRQCADWIDQHDVRGSVLAGTRRTGPRINLNLDDMRRCFPGATVKRRVAEYCTTYLLNSDGIDFQADEYGRRPFETTETEVVLSPCEEAR